LPCPRFEDEAFGAVFVIEAGFFVFEDAGGLAGEVFAVDVFGIEDVAELFLGEAIELGVIGVKLGTENGAALLVPLEWRERGLGVRYCIESQPSLSVGAWYDSPLL